jgi:hypothetical protein
MRMMPHVEHVLRWLAVTPDMYRIDPSLDYSARDEQQLRLQFAVVEPDI